MSNQSSQQDKAVSENQDEEVHRCSLWEPGAQVSPDHLSITNEV